jgi:hypothetical protein
LDPAEEAKRIVTVASSKGIILRLIGGLAIRFHCHGPHSIHLRQYHDIDLFGLNIQFKGINSVFKELGYVPNPRFNAMYAETRLQFIDKEQGRHVDIFFDKIRMEHTLDFRKRIHLDDLTIPISDLLLSKLTIIKLTAKDVQDIIAILDDHAIGESDDRETLNIDYISRLCSDDWSLYRTVTGDLTKMIEFVQEGTFSAEDKRSLLKKLEAIERDVKTREKTRRWKLRSLVGERKRWYDLVEMGEEQL